MKHHKKRFLLAAAIACIVYAHLWPANNDIRYRGANHDAPWEKSVAHLVAYNGNGPYNNTLDWSEKQLTSVCDLPNFVHTLHFVALTKVCIQRNHLLFNSLASLLTCAPALTDLDFSHNEVHAIHTMPPHDNLERLYLNDNHIKSFNFKNFFTNLRTLKQCLLHNNHLCSDAITNITGTHESVEEVWFGSAQLTEAVQKACIRACPKLCAELIAGSSEVQKHYTESVAWFDTRRYSFEWPAWFVGSCVAGGAVGFTIRSLSMLLSRQPYMTPPEVVISVFCSTMCLAIGSAAVIPPLARGAGFVYDYLNTEPQHRYRPWINRVIKTYPTALTMQPAEYRAGPPTPEPEG